MSTRVDTTRTVTSPAPVAVDSSVSALLVSADSLFRPEPDSAGAIFSRAHDVALRMSDSTGLAKALTGMGQVARLQGRFDEARRYGEQALAMKLQLQMKGDLFRSYNALGLLARDEERLADARSLLERAATAARSVGDAVGVAKTIINIGLVFDGRGQFDSARAALQAGADAASAAGDTASLGRALTNLASLDIRLGDPLSGIASLELSRRLGTAAGDALNEVNSLAQLATAYDAVGEPQSAFAALDSSIALARVHGFRVEEADDVRVQADLYAAAGDFRRALDAYARAATLDSSLDRPEEQGDVLRSEARVQFTLGQSNVAAARAAEALRVHRAGGFRASELDDLCLLAELAQAGNRSSEAESHLRAARQVAWILNTNAANTQVAIAEGRVANRAGNATRVLRVLNIASVALSVAPTSAVAEAMALKARAYARLGRMDAAVAAGRQAVAAVERVRGNYASVALRTSYAADRASVYAELVLALLRLGRSDEALQVADAARGRALLDHLTSARVTLDSAPPSARTSIEAERLLRRIDELVARLEAMQRRPPLERTSFTVANSREVADRLSAARGEYEALIARSTPRTPSPLAFLRSREADSRVLRHALGPGEALIEYLVTPEQLLTFVVTASGVAPVTADVNALDLFARVRLTRELLGRRNEGATAARVLEGLYDLLIRPAADAGLLDRAHRLIIVPYASLTYLPFSALLNSRTGHYLAEDFSLMSLPSAGALVALRDADTSHVAPGGDQKAVVALAPFPAELPGSQNEVQRVARAMPRASLFIGASATEMRVRQAISSDAVVHTATHAVMNARNPLFSRLELARGRVGQSRDDGRLEVREVLEMRIHSPLIFLSGCDTGLGASWSTPYETGEDYTTLAQALLFAGARNVVATLWRIDDAAAAELAERFYRGLARTPAPEALVEAQLSLLRSVKYRDPYYWAAYQVSGGEPINSAFAIRGPVSVQLFDSGLTYPKSIPPASGTSK